MDRRIIETALGRDPNKIVNRMEVPKNTEFQVRVRVEGFAVVSALSEGFDKGLDVFRQLILAGAGWGDLVRIETCKERHT